jgi:hypothetical protein
VESGVWRNCGRNANSEYIPTPNSSDATLVVQTAGRRIMRMSMSGESLRTSTRTHSAHSSTEATNSATLRPEDQPQTRPWLTGSSRQTSQPDSSRAAGTLMRPGVRLTERGTNAAEASPALIVMIMGTQNSQW